MTDSLELTLFEILMITPKDVDISLVLFYHTINSGERGPLSHKWYHVYTFFFFLFAHIAQMCPLYRNYCFFFDLVCTPPLHCPICVSVTVLVCPCRWPTG